MMRLPSKTIPSQFWQWNLHHSTAATAELVKLFSESTCNQTIALVTEPHLVRNLHIGKLSHGIEVFSANCKPRAAIFAKNINLWLCPSFTGRDVTTCLMKTGKKEYYIVSAYLDIEVNEIPVELLRLLAQHGQKPIILGMDSNSHSTLWGSKDTNRRGERLEERIALHNLCVLNEGQTPTFVSPLGSTVIDVTLCTSNIYSDIYSWHVIDEDEFSDHRRIEFFIDDTPTLPPKSWDVRNARWPQFQQEMEERSKIRLASQDDRSNLDSLALDFKRDLNLSLLRSTTWKQHGRLKPKIKWWNDELSSLRMEYKALRNTLFLDDEAKEQLKGKKREFQRLLRNAKRNAWREHVSSVKNVDEMAKLTKSLFRSKHSLGMLKKENGSHTESLEELASTLFDNFFPLSTTVRSTKATDNPQIATSIPEDAITHRKVRASLNSFGKYKAEGPDGFRPIVLQQMGDLAIERLCQIYRRCLTEGYTPEDWRKSKVVFIPKPGKNDYSQVKSFRPISLTSFLFKGLERIVLWHMEEKMPDLFHKEQHAFRKGHSTETALLRFVDTVESAVLRRGVALAVMMDISGAFDNVLPCRVISALRKKGVDDFVVKWYAQYLLNRTASTTLSGKTYSRSLTRGTPQGGVLSPTAWNLVFDSLLDSLNDGPARAIGYADDCSVVIKGFDPSSMVNVMQTFVDKAVNWGHANGLKFSPEKTEAIFFTRKTNLGKPPPLQIEGKEVKYTKSVKYLGVTFDNQLRMTKHVNDRIAKCKSKLARVMSAIGVKWGPQPYLLLWMYKAFIIPALGYASLVWGHRVGNRFDEKFGRLNRLALKSLGVMRLKTPTAGLEVIFCTPPIQLQIQALGLKAFQRWKSSLNTTWDHISMLQSAPSMMKFWAKLSKSFGPNLELEDKAFCYNWNPQHNLADESTSSKFGTVAKISIDQTGKRGALEIRFEHESGRAKTSYEFRPCNSASQILCTLIQLACNLMLAKVTDSSPQPILLMLPKLPSLLGKPWLTTSTEAKCLEALGLCKMKYGKIFLRRFKALRKDFTNSRGIKVPPPIGTFADEVDRWLIDKWSKQWSKNPTCKQTRFWFPTIKPEFSLSLSKWSRAEVGMMVQFLTGHCWLNRHKFLVEESSTKKCRLCDMDGEDHDSMETPIHLTTNCQALTQVTREAFCSSPHNPLTADHGNQVASAIQAHWTPLWLISVLRDDTVISLEGFLGRTNVSDTQGYTTQGGVEGE